MLQSPELSISADRRRVGISRLTFRLAVTACRSYSLDRKLFASGMTRREQQRQPFALGVLARLVYIPLKQISRYQLPGASILVTRRSRCSRCSPHAGHWQWSTRFSPQVRKPRSILCGVENCNGKGLRGSNGHKTALDSTDWDFIL